MIKVIKTPSFEVKKVEKNGRTYLEQVNKDNTFVIENLDRRDLHIRISEGDYKYILDGCKYTELNEKQVEVTAKWWKISLMEGNL